MTPKILLYGHRNIFRQFSSYRHLILKVFLAHHLKSYKMKKFIILLLAVGLAVSVKAQFNADKDPLITKSLNNQSIRKVIARTSGGSIVVAGVSEGEARLEVYVKPSGMNFGSVSKSELQEKLADDYDLIISTANNQLEVTAKSKSNINWKRQLSISYKIYVPRNVTSDLSTSGGSIKLSNLNGNQRFRTSGGSLQIADIRGNIEGKTSGGSINADKCTGGEISLATSGGSLKLNNLKGIIQANTSGGSIRGSNISGELKTHTSGGSVNLDGLSCSLETSTSGGSMNISVVDPGKYVSVSTSGGSVNMSIPGSKGMNLKVSGQSVRVNPLKNFNGTTDKRSINGTVNGGGIPVNVSGSGNVNLSLI